MKRYFMTILSLSLIAVSLAAGPASAHHRESTIALKRRVAALEAKVATLSSQVAQLQAKTTSLDTAGKYVGAVAQSQVLGLACSESDARFYATGDPGITFLDCASAYPRQGLDAATGNRPSSLSDIDMSEIRAAAAARRG